MIKKTVYFLEAILNSYAILFFSNQKLFSILLILISFFNPLAGLSGLIATFTAVTMANLMGFNAQFTHLGVYSFNAVLLGIGFGTFFENSPVFFVLLMIAAMLTLVLSVTLSGIMGKYGLPFLSLPFVITFWLILLASKEFSNLGLSQRNIYWINEMYSAGGKPLLSLFNSIENIPLPSWLSTYFKALSSILFQDNILAGILLSIGMVVYSRIAFTLSLVGFFGAYLFNDLTGAYQVGINSYHLGSNYMMVAIAIGGFFTIPSIYSYLWAFFSVPVTNILVISLSKIFGVFTLPIFSLPFCLMILMYLYFLKLRIKPGKLVLTPIQHYSPEINLYQYKNNNERLKDEYYYNFYLPFIGQWAVSQGYDGSITHKDDWSKALDFIILDKELKSYSGKGTSLENYYCYNKPIIAPADGYVQEIADFIDDNEVGEINREQNWGNSIVLYHLPGLYSKLSHLKKHSFTVKQGEYVKKGQVIASCGNSGRSPEPHLHFQIQSTPYIGSKTLAYPISYYFQHDEKSLQFKSFVVPEEGKFISNVATNKLLHQAFLFQPGYTTKFKENNKIETWEVYTDAYNQTYISCKENSAVAYFVNNGTVFYFTNFYGDKNALLFQFYTSVFKIAMSFMPEVCIKDSLPLSIIKAPFVKWINDFIAPFITIIKPIYILKYKSIDDEYFSNEILLETTVELFILGNKKVVKTSHITLREGKIKHWFVNEAGKERLFTCID
jgi:urea transporter